MGLEKAIASGKEHRKEYRGSKRVDCTCRNHGSCSYCESNRTQAAQKFAAATTDELIYEDMVSPNEDVTAEEIREDICPDPWDDFNQTDENR